MKKPTKDGIRLNKYIANAGICTRRKADEHILAGKVKLNGKVVTKMGIRVQANDEVIFQEQIISHKQKPVYLLINKPQDFSSQKSSKKNIWQLLGEVDPKNLFIPHSLSAVSCGLSLLTNDVSLTEKLKETFTKKLYYLHLENELTDRQLLNFKNKLEKAKLKVEAINFVIGKPKSHIGIELFDQADKAILKLLVKLKLKILKLDRVMFCGITKKDLPRGKWRHLTAKEIITLKHF